MSRLFRYHRVLLRKHWKLTAIAVVSLSLALALAILSLSLANTFLFLQPAAPQAERLVSIHTRTTANTVDQVSYPDFQFYRKNNHVFTDVAAEPNSISIFADTENQRKQIRVFARPVSDNYFAVLGLRPFLGRFFIAGDDESKTSPAVMTYTCWRRLGQDRQIVGKAIAGYTIVGVTP
jgi:hypothetical protein